MFLWGFLVFLADIMKSLGGTILKLTAPYSLGHGAANDILITIINLSVIFRF